MTWRSVPFTCEVAVHCWLAHPLKESVAFYRWVVALSGVTQWCDSRRLRVVNIRAFVVCLNPLDPPGTHARVKLQSWSAFVLPSTLVAPHYYRFCVFGRYVRVTSALGCVRLRWAYASGRARCIFVYLVSSDPPQSSFDPSQVLLPSPFPPPQIQTLGRSHSDRNSRADRLGTNELDCRSSYCLTFPTRTYGWVYSTSASVDVSHYS